MQEKLPERQNIDVQVLWKPPCDLQGEIDLQALHSSWTIENEAEDMKLHKS